MITNLDFIFKINEIVEIRVVDQWTDVDLNGSMLPTDRLQITVGERHGSWGWRAAGFG
jgi:hypothetical protein